ncbi:MAG: helix-turn-helix domain-containing protein [Evtepia gabavorous]
MTQEFVAETLCVSRQSVSTWENGFQRPQHLQSDCPCKAL